MLDAARSKVAMMLAKDVVSNEQQKHLVHTQNPQLPPVVPLSTSLYNGVPPQTILSDNVPEVVAHDNTTTTTTHDCDYLDLLLENDDWFKNEKQDVVQEEEVVVSDDDNNDGCSADPIISSEVFENDTWFMAKEQGTTSNVMNKSLPVLPTSSYRTTSQPSTIQKDFVHFVSPVTSQPMIAPDISPVASIANQTFDGLLVVSSNQTILQEKQQQSSQGNPNAVLIALNNKTEETPRESRLEKNREAAKKRRLQKKMEHEKLQQSVAFYTQCKFLLCMQISSLLDSVLIYIWP